MESQPGIDASQSQAPGTLEKFHLGLAADGTSCAMVFVDDQHRSIACLASFTDLNGFIISLTRAAAEMEQRRKLQPQTEVSADDDVTAAGLHPPEAVPGTMTVASSDFASCPEDGYVLGALVGTDGQFLPIRLCPDVAHEMTRNILLAARAGSPC